MFKATVAAIVVEREIFTGLSHAELERPNHNQLTESVIVILVQALGRYRLPHHYQTIFNMESLLPIEGGVLSSSVLRGHVMLRAHLKSYLLNIHQVKHGAVLGPNRGR